MKNLPEKAIKEFKNIFNTCSKKYYSDKEISEFAESLFSLLIQTLKTKTKKLYNKTAVTNESE